MEARIHLRSRPSTLDTGKVTAAVRLTGSDFSSLDVLTVTLYSPQIATPATRTQAMVRTHTNLSLQYQETHTHAPSVWHREEPHLLPVCSFAGSGYVNDEFDRESDGYM